MSEQAEKIWADVASAKSLAVIWYCLLISINGRILPLQKEKKVSLRKT
ncbi:1492_t:CDS:2 [Ambispora gerdemannii]|uniref:1492_t:CDS:1 n=1 Tax=Ambispora gerdemannii TaxID=144530 RepID=A0A9N8YNJ8_9GLOM|nr:1492_t:CDS:2 [Ambispora gerdemannii]